MARKEWIWLDEGDDWGVRYVAIEARNESGTPNRDRALHIRAKERCDIRWPDGTNDHVRLLLRREVNAASDMGHEYQVECFFPGFKYMINGLEVWIELTKVQVRRKWAEDHSPSFRS